MWLFLWKSISLIKTLRKKCTKESFLWAAHKSEIQKPTVDNRTSFSNTSKSKYKFLLSSSRITNFKTDHVSIGTKSSLISSRYVSKMGKQTEDERKCKIRGILLDHESVLFGLRMADAPAHWGAARCGPPSSPSSHGGISPQPLCTHREPAGDSAMCVVLKGNWHGSLFSSGGMLKIKCPEWFTGLLIPAGGLALC